jgi:hypothetical protein
MAHITRGTRIELLTTRERNPLDTTYVVEAITTHQEADGQKQYTLTVRTERQRCFPRELTGSTQWTDTQIREGLAAGTMRIVA